MARFLVTRVLLAAATLWVVSIVVFAIARVQGDPRDLLFAQQFGNQDPKQWEEFGRQIGLDKPMVYQYGLFLGRAFKGDLGKSIWQYKPVSSLIWERLPATAELALGAIIFSTISIPLGVLAAIRRGSMWDLLARAIAILGQSMPSFWIGIMLVFVFAVRFELLPTSQRGGLSHFVLPVITLGIFPLAGMLRLIRSSMLDVLDSEYVKLARAKGVSGTVVIWKHALRSALVAPLTFAGLLIAGLLTGSIIVETVFVWPGMGLLAIGGVQSNDYPITQGVVLVFTMFFVLSSLVVDIVYTLVDPRIRII